MMLGCKRFSGSSFEDLFPLYIFAYFVIQGSVTLKKTDINEDEVRKARVKCEMLAALEACRLLHVMGELTDDLQPVFRYT